MLRSMSSKIFDIEDGANAREKHVARNQITWSLQFVNGMDDKLYLISLKNLFFFPTFWPIMLIFMTFIAAQSGVLEEVQQGDPFLAISFACNMLNLVIIVLFTVARAIDYFHSHMSETAMGFSKFFLRKFLRGRAEDLVILLLAFAQGLYQLSLISRDLCLSCGTALSVQACEADVVRNFPLNQAAIGFIALLILPIYFKSIHRQIVLMAWAILSLFIVAAHLYGHYRLRYITVLLIIFFFVSLYEYERYKMTSYLLSKEALSLEQSKLIIAQEKSKIIERKLHMALVHQILPPKVAEQIIAGKQVAPESFEEVTIFFSDVEGFTTICSQVTPVEVVRMLNDLYTVMDYCTSLFPVYKVETIGDAYMLVGGLPVRDANHAQAIADFSLLVQQAVRCVASPADGKPIRIRIGLHSGPVMAGVVGNLMPRYCLFGDTVNTASRMESNGSPGLIHCSDSTAQILQRSGKFVLTCRGEIEVKGKGRMTTHWLDSADETSNKNSNQDAIRKCLSMVRDLLAQQHSANAGDGSFRGAEGSEAQLGALQKRLSLDASFAAALQSDKQGSQRPQTDPSTTTQQQPQSRSTAEDLLALASDLRGDSGKAAPEEKSATVSPRGAKYQEAGAQQQEKQQKARVSRVAFKTSLFLSQRDPQHILESEGAFCVSGAKLLVVEDSPAQRKMLVKRLLDAEGSWDVSCAVSGEDALAKLKAAKFAFDVVLVDENLSIADGLYGHELVEVMRTSFHMDQTIIIACTSNPAKVGPALLESGVDCVWPKPPPTSAVMRQKLQQLLEARYKSLLQAQLPPPTHEHPAAAQTSAAPNTAAPASATPFGKGLGGFSSFFGPHSRAVSSSAVQPGARDAQESSVTASSLSGQLLRLFSANAATSSAPKDAGSSAK